MAWMLWLLSSIDVGAEVISFLKAGGGALGAYVGKAVWRKIVPEAKRCMIERCHGVAFCRGLCNKCYKNAKAKVSAGMISWETLEEKGLCGSEYNNDPFDDAYSKAMRDE